MMGFKDIGPDEFKEGLEKNPNAELIDVRTPDEYEDAHLKGARLMNIMSPDFTEKVEQLPKDKVYGRAWIWRAVQSAGRYHVLAL